MKKTNSKSSKDRIISRSFEPAKDTRLLSKCRLKNLYIDYLGSADALESVPGYRRIASLGEKIHSIFSLKASSLEEFIYIHSGNRLYRFDRSGVDESERLRPILELENAQSFCHSYGKSAFITDGKALYGFDHEGEPYLISENTHVAKCKVMAIFDDRLFLGGNPDNPDRLFCSTPISDGSISFPDEAVYDLCSGSGEVSALISHCDRLWIFRSRLGGGDILRLARTNAPGKIYLEEHLLSGICTISAILHLDRILLLSQSEVLSLEIHTDSLPEIKRIASLPLSLIPIAELQTSSLGIWMGYIALMSRGKILLLDTRLSPCAIFPIESIGDYVGDRRAYRYTGEHPGECDLIPTADDIAYGEIFSFIDKDGEAHIYENRDGVKLPVYPTDERIGGDFTPAILYFCENDLMWFATANGELFLFNNDKRGSAPDDMDSEEKEEYERLYGGFIHPSFYSFADHAIESLIELPVDDGGRADLKKRTIPGGIGVESKNMMKSSCEIAVISDGRELMRQILRGGSLNFSDLDFRRISGSDEDSTSHTLARRGPAWRSKKILIRSCDFRTPMAISSITHSFLMRDRKQSLH